MIFDRANAYPVFARQYFSSPREVSGRIACSYCHLGRKAIEVEIPQSVFPNTVFEAVIKVPYQKELKQLNGQGQKVGLNIGAILILPDGFSLAPTDRISDSLKEKINKLAFLPYNNSNKSTFMAGPVSGEKYEELVFPILSPGGDKNVSYLKYPIYVGGNRGRGQIYPGGEKSNNNVYTASVSGIVSEIAEKGNKGFDVVITTNTGDVVTENVGVGADIIVKEGQEVSVEQPLTTNPNVGGFGQSDVEIVLQNPLRVQGLLLFFFFVLLTQTLLVLKKKQFEKVQLSEMNF
jgi:apocytochrome f